jgi:asparagine synthase (glutamine-hydrolysing)
MHFVDELSDHTVHSSSTSDSGDESPGHPLSQAYSEVMMCGIVGLVGPQEDSWLSRMNAVQVHRGPDDAGEWRDRDRNVSLAMRRLAIVDLSEGKQPMKDERERHVLVFNGEIFNAPLLRRELEGLGMAFRTDHSDTEVILQGYRCWGEKVVERLNGMFAFVIYDRDHGTLFGARDPSGIKPLYFLCQGQRMAFASELKSIFELPWLDRSENALDLESLSHYLTLQFVPAPRTILKDVSKLAAGHCFRYSLAKSALAVRRYWSPPLPCSIAGSRASVVLEVRRLMEAAVRRWLMSDVPVGCSLSGGIDSAAVVGVMGSLGVAPIRTWTLGFEESDADQDERALAQIVARKWNTQHTEIVLSARTLLDDLSVMTRHLDEPYGGGLPSWFVFREMHDHVKVAMTGTGGDELFGNYNKWRAHVPCSRIGVRRLARALYQHGLCRVLMNPHGALYHGYTGDRVKSGLMAERVLPISSTAELMEHHWRASGRHDPKDIVAAVDFCLQLPDEFLHMTDRFSMAWSIEARTPFLDRDLVEYVLALPAQLRIDPLTYKGLLREVARAWVPDELFPAPKRGFVLPLRSWTRRELRPMLRELLGEVYLRRQGLFEPKAVGALLKHHLNGTRDSTDLVWTLLMFQLWWQAFLSPSSASPIPGGPCV